MVGHAGSLTRTVYMDVTMTRSTVKVKVTGLLNVQQLAQPCMLAAMTAAPLQSFLVCFKLCKHGGPKNRGHYYCSHSQNARTTLHDFWTYFTAVFVNSMFIFKWCQKSCRLFQALLRQSDVVVSVFWSACIVCQVFSCTTIRVFISVCSKM